MKRKCVKVKAHKRLEKARITSYRRIVGLHKAFLLETLLKQVKKTSRLATRNYARLEKIYPVTAEFTSSRDIGK